MGRKAPTQKEQIIRFMKQNGSITRLDAATKLFIMELSSRIGELEDRGWEFNKVNESHKNTFGQTKTFTRYSIKKEGLQW